MSVFAYKAIDPTRVRSEGTVIADSPRQARQILRSRGLRVRDLQQEHNSPSLWRLLTRQRASTSRVTMAISELATLLSVGVPLVDALETVSRQYRGRFRTSLLLLKDRVAAGASLADAMSEQSGVFDELTRQMVEVGENSGSLDSVLEQLTDFRERTLQLKDRVVSALLYPAFVLFTSLGVTLFLMVVVVPMLLANLLQAGRPLPWPTRLLKQLSDLLVEHGFLIAIIVVGIIAAFCVLVRLPRGQLLWHRTLLRLPLVGTMSQKQDISRLAMVISTLMRSGMVYLKAVEIGARTTRNVVMRQALQRSCQDVQAGRDIGVALERTGVFPPVVIQVFTVGQESGRLEELLDRLAIKYDRQVASLSTRLASILEPLLILLLAVFVGFILFATLLPILEAGHVI